MVVDFLVLLKVCFVQRHGQKVIQFVNFQIHRIEILLLDQLNVVIVIEAIL